MKRASTAPVTALFPVLMATCKTHDALLVSTRPSWHQIIMLAVSPSDITPVPRLTRVPACCCFCQAGPLHTAADADGAAGRGPPALRPAAQQLPQGGPRRPPSRQLGHQRSNTHLTTGQLGAARRSLMSTAGAQAAGTPGRPSREDTAIQPPSGSCGCVKCTDADPAHRRTVLGCLR